MKRKILNIHGNYALVDVEKFIEMERQRLACHKIEFKQFSRPAIHFILLLLL